MELELMRTFEKCEKGLNISSIKDSNFSQYIKILLKKNYIEIKNNQTIYQTTKGMEALGGFCGACEWIPCDCNWGN